MTEEKTGNKKIIFIILAVVIILGLICAGFFFLRKSEEKTTEQPKVGFLDQDKIFKLEAFVNADKKLKQVVKDKETKFKKTVESLDKNNPKDQEKLRELYFTFQQQLNKERSRLRLPLYKNVEASVAQIALKRNMNVVLDKNIVVCGGADVTDEVIEIMKSKDKIEFPPEKDIDASIARSKVGYFDQMVIAKLPDFRKAQNELDRYQQELIKKYNKVAEKKKLTPEQQEQLKASFFEQVEKYRADLYAPIYRKVNRIVKDVALEKNLNLVVNKENVMYGGVNMTDEVADKMVGKKKEEEKK
ncbi:MAG: OmpH family outer membrane protein [Candidatus Eremiobacteraeota bacterium]|nr:OmpH family outer membrane protein [Candidatus Eremiobacteraeota bacterium]